MAHRRIIIGDVHGQYDALVQLLEAIAPGTNDQVYFLGDLIDRGPDSKAVVELVMEHHYPCLRGNHEDMMLKVIAQTGKSSELFHAWLHSGGDSTLTSYNYNIPSAHIDWLIACPTHLDLEDVWLVHAGVHPTIPLQEQTAEHFCWIRDAFLGRTSPYFSDKLIIVGHTITFTLPGVQPGELAQGAGWLGIDTGAYHPKSGWLTGVDITHRRAYQANTQQKQVRELALDMLTTKVNPASVQRRRSSLIGGIR